MKIKQTVLSYNKFTNDTLIIPKRFENVEYNGTRIPGVKEQENLRLGANCQLFAYELLKEMKKELPNFRSSDLWEDNIYTIKIENNFIQFDIILYHYKPEAYGAHIALYLEAGKVLHLSKENKIPMIEAHNSMLNQEKYRYCIGVKRVLDISNLKTEFTI